MAEIWLPRCDRALRRYEVSGLVTMYFEWADVDNIVDIAFLESKWHTGAWNQDGEDSRGLLQINVQAWPAFAVYNLFDPQINVFLARRIFDAQGYRAWYNSSRVLNLIAA